MILRISFINQDRVAPNVYKQQLTNVAFENSGHLSLPRAAKTLLAVGIGKERLYSQFNESLNSCQLVLVKRQTQRGRIQEERKQ